MQTILRSRLPRRLPALVPTSRPLSSSTSLRASYRRFGFPEAPSGSSGPGWGGSRGKRSPNGFVWSLDWREWGTRQRVGAGVVGIGGTYYASHLEQVPETGRWRFMNTSPAYETSMAKEVRKELMQEYGDRLLPASHPVTRHVTRVVERILQANHLGSLTHTTPSSTPSRPPSSWDADPWSSGSSNEDKYAPGTSAGSEQREWNLMVVDDPKMANAMASFGNIVVFTGILPIAKDEGGLASVLAHEIGHVTARHNSEKISSMQVGLLISTLLVAVIGIDFGISGFLKQILYELPGDRRVELEADAIGLRLMSKACYRPEAASEMFTRMGEMEGGKRMNVNWLYTHPTSETRVKALEALMPSAHTIQEASDCGVTASAFGAFKDAFQFR